MDNLQSVVDQHSTIPDQAIEDAVSSIRLAQGRDQFSFHNLLPPDLAAAVELVTEVLPADAMTSVLTLLCGYSGLLKLGTKVTPDGRYKVPCNMYVGLVGPSGLTKSPLQRVLIYEPSLKLQLEEMGLGECLQAGTVPAFRAGKPWL